MLSEEERSPKRLISRIDSELADGISFLEAALDTLATYDRATGYAYHWRVEKVWIILTDCLTQLNRSVMPIGPLIAAAEPLETGNE